MKLIVLILCCVYGASTFYEPTCKSSGLSCQDCTTMKLCVNLIFGLSNWQQISCTDAANSKGRFCNPTTNACEAKPRGDCDPLAKFACTRDGRYPDTSDCTRFLRCAGGNRTIVECPTNHVYSHLYGTCVLQLTGDDCQTIDCTDANSFVPVPSDRSIYVECVQKTGVLNVCPQSYQTFDATTRSCVDDACNAGDGSMANPRDCRAYFECDDARKRRKETRCATGGFDPASGRCVPGYELVCNEMQTFRRIVGRIVPPSVLSLLKPISNLLDTFDLNPLSLLLRTNLVGIDRLRAGLSIVDYVVANRRVPPAILADVVDTAMALVPAGLRGFVETFVKRVLGIRAVTAMQKRSVDDDDDADLATQLRLYSWYLPHVLRCVRSNLNEWTATLNGYFGRDLLKIDNNGAIAIDSRELRDLLARRYHDALVYFCGGKAVACAYLSRVWTDEHAARYDEAIASVRLPVDYGEWKSMATADGFSATDADPFAVAVRASNALKATYSEAARRVAMLVDDLLGLLIGRLQNTFVRLIFGNFTRVGVDDVVALLQRFRDHLQNYTLKMLQ